ncbi:MAG: hypothetical protein JOZ60_00515 [Verrucomicrobia bacterium]|nr:hypothetical protein [Verrucomicrobiota bacterium]
MTWGRGLCQTQYGKESKNHNYQDNWRTFHNAEHIRWQTSGLVLKEKTASRALKQEKQSYEIASLSPNSGHTHYFSATGIPAEAPSPTIIAAPPIEEQAPEELPNATREHPWQNSLGL